MATDKPDISEIDVAKLQERPFPSQPVYRISVSHDAYEAIHRHAKADTEVELCGVLIGEVFRDVHGPFLEITGAIRGEHAASQGAHVVFTHDTWSHINSIKDADFPQTKIVGWYHTHPCFGVFLSSQDLFIHKNFFNLPWQVAFVIDPISEDEGFFTWHDGQAKLVNQHWIGGSMKLAAKNDRNLEGRISEPQTGVVATTRKQNLPSLKLVYILVFSLLVTAVFFSYTIKQYGALKQQLILLQTSKVETSKAYVEMAIVRDALSNNETLANLGIKLKQIANHFWCYGAVSTWYQKELVGETVRAVAGVESVDLEGVVVTHMYVVSPSDNLSKIAAKVYGQPHKWTEIFKANRQRIGNPDRIRASVLLFLPE
jgi:proteasome lid subunit RPN8/RPN11